MGSLTVIEEKHYAELLETVDNGVKTFYEVGMALMQIRDNRYYRKTHGTFEELCKDRWGFKRSYAYELIKASEIADNLSGAPDIPAPTSVAQLRPLTTIKDPEEQREIYQKAVETAPEGKVTAKHVENTIKEIHAEKTDDKVFVNNDSPNLSSVKTMWNACNKGDKIKFIRWVRKYFQGYLTKERGEEPAPKVDKWKNLRSKPEVMSDEFRSAFDNMQRVLYNERETHWKTTSREVAEKYINQLLRMTEK